MGKLKKDNIDRLFVVKECVHREICDANIYYKLLFELINGILENKSFYKNFNIVFSYIREALETKYILALAKIFALTKEESLWKLIEEAKKLPVSIFDLRLTREPYFIQTSLQCARKCFFQNYNSYITKIKKINTILSPLRNTQRAHNYPLNSLGEKVTWQQTKDWLNFAEGVFVNTMEATCDSSPSVGNFVPDELSTDVRYLISVIKKVNLK